MTRNRRRQLASFRPSVEVLEDRTLLAVIPVTTLADSGTGSLRQAILDANAMPGDDTITFSVTGTINLTSALPNLSSNIDMQGPGATNLTVRRGTADAFRIFFVSPDATVGLSGLTISNGFAPTAAPNNNGGGIFNSGLLTLNNVTVSGNSASAGNGGAFTTTPARSR